jgi:ElaB/YqjD/DUF883 family membrane-anchored ribosome-binding protein
VFWEIAMASRLSTAVGFPKSWTCNILWVFATLSLSAGCAGKAKMADDPFRRPGYGSSGGRSGGGSFSDPRYDTGAAVRDTFERANEKARDKDVSSDVSTDPLSDKLQASRNQAEGALRSASDSARDKLDPLINSANDQLDQARQKIEGMSQNFAEGSETFELYEKVRRQLDAVGAKNWKFEKDPASGESIFRVEMPHQNNPNLFRVFEAKSKDELKAMYAVAEQVQRWVASGSAK